MHALLASLVSLFLLAPIADGWLGVYLSTERDEPVVTEVIPDSPADKAGLKAGDVMLAVGETATATRDAFIAAIQAGKPGERVNIKLRRGDKEQIVAVKLGERPQQNAPAKVSQPTQPKGSQPPQPAAESAPESREPAVAQPKARGYLGLAVRETPEGVVIERVLDDGPAKKAGVNAGDTVTNVGDHLVKELGDLDRFLANAKPGKKVALGLRNADGARSVTVTLAERPTAGFDDVPTAEVEAAHGPQPKVLKKARTPSEPQAREEAKPAPDLEAELQTLRAELAKLRQELEELRKAKGRE